MNTQLCFASNFLAVFVEVKTASDFKRACAWDYCLIVINILNCPEAIASGFLDHGDGVLVGASDENGARSRVLDSRNESILLFSQNVLLNQISISQIVFCKFFNRVDSVTSAGQHNSLHVSSFSSPQCQNSSVGKHLQANRVDSLLVDDDKALVVAFADFVLELNDLLTSLVSEPAFALSHFVPVGSIREEELRINFGLFVLKGDVACENVAIFETLRHVGVPSSMV